MNNPIKLYQNRAVKLKTEKRLERDPKYGFEVEVTTHRRGLLKQIIRSFPPNRVGSIDTTSTRQELENLCDMLRDRLDSVGLPSDRHPHWIRIGDGEWREVSEEELRQGPLSNTAGAFWISRLDDLTEPLSEERLAGKLLWALLNLLNLELSDDQLWHVNQTMHCYHLMWLSGAVNHFAMTGWNAAQGRQAGPAARREIANETRGVIRDYADQYQREHPQFTGQANATARGIHKNANKALRERNLLNDGRADLSVKTIADYIRGKK